MNDLRSLNQIADVIERYGRDLAGVQGYGLSLIEIAEEIRHHPDNPEVGR